MTLCQSWLSMISVPSGWSSSLTEEVVRVRDVPEHVRRGDHPGEAVLRGELRGELPGEVILHHRDTRVVAVFRLVGRLDQHGPGAGERPGCFP